MVQQVRIGPSVNPSYVGGALYVHIHTYHICKITIQPNRTPYIPARRTRTCTRARVRARARGRGRTARAGGEADTAGSGAGAGAGSARPELLTGLVFGDFWGLLGTEV